MPGSKAHRSTYKQNSLVQKQFFWVRRSHINASFPHLTVFCLFDPEIKFRGETFQMVSSGHLRSFFSLRFISTNQFSDINQCCVIQFPFRLISV